MTTQLLPPQQFAVTHPHQRDAFAECMGIELERAPLLTFPRLRIDPSLIRNLTDETDFVVCIDRKVLPVNRFRTRRRVSQP